MKISILGAGAIGSMFGGLLKRSLPGDKVLLVARGEHGAAMQRTGAVELVGPWGTRSVPVDVTSDVSHIDGSDLVLITTKGQATEAALASAAPHLGTALVASLQNGINDHTYSRFVPLERLVMGMTATNMAFVAPGRVSMQLDGISVFGPPAGGTMHAGVEQVVEVFKKIDSPGLTFMAHPNALGMRYNKLTINALGYASCLSASNFILDALADRGWRRGVGWPIVAECRRVLSEAGIQLEPMPGRSDISKIERLMKVFSLPIVGRMARLAVRRRFQRTPIVFSLLQDLQRGKATEVEYINGEIVRLAKAVDSTAPVNCEVVRMVHELEKQSENPPRFFKRKQVIDRIREVTR